MKNAARRVEAFTVIELLVVVAIIGILIATLPPVLGPGPHRAKIPRAKAEIAGIAAAIRDFQADNGRYPVSQAVIQAAASVGAEKGGPEDCTFGAEVLSANAVPLSLSTPDLTNNAEVMAILLDLQQYGNGVPTINAGHACNPKRTAYLYANLSRDTHSPGVGLDGVYRDPWGTPYIISLDLNGDNKTRDAFYCRRAVSQQTRATGYNGLANAKDPAGNSDCFEANGSVMVWSPGPDKKMDPSQPARVGANKDNILSWK